MKSFISETLDNILKDTDSFENVIFVFPSQRAGVFVRQLLKDKLTVGFLPKIITIEQFIEDVSGIKKVSTVQLLFHFYTIYKKHTKNPHSFDVFTTWAFTVLQDFNEIDQHLVNAREIFVYLRDIQRLRKWGVSETKLIEDHFYFIEKLEEYYRPFYEFLKEKSIGYQGLLYREATEKIDYFLQKNIQTKFFFIGFNALNKAEEILFQKAIATEQAKIYWDIDTYFLESNHTAGNFIRKYKREWKYYQKNPLKSSGDWFSKQKDIEIIGVPKNISQIKYTGEILKKLPNYNNTAFVLTAENLLPIALNSLPKSVTQINITMGYPLTDIPISQFFTSIFQLFISQEKLQKAKNNSFYYKDVVNFFKHHSIHQLFSKENFLIENAISKHITDKNKVFISQKEVFSILEDLKNPAQKIIYRVFNPFTIISEFLDHIIKLIDLLKQYTKGVEKEYLFRFYKLFVQLQNLHSEFGYFNDLKTVKQLFKQLLKSEKMTFQGEPLRGLQLMGMLETRVLDFENVIITSVNEGVLPSGITQNSFIPFDVKRTFKLPTYNDKDAIFSYHFFRLIQRAKRVFLLYNTENDSFGNGEKSRFITQLELIKQEFSEKIISPKVVTEKLELKEIPKEKSVLEKLEIIAEKGISPSALVRYLYNPIEFYQQKILQIKQLEILEEDIATNTIGTVIHDTLDTLYKPFEGQFVLLENINQMQQIAKGILEKYFKTHFKGGEITTGKNLLIFEVANRWIQHFLSREKDLLKDGENKLKIIATEREFATKITVETIPFPIKIKGIVDRIDEFNGVVRIIDYKTGMVKNTDLKIADLQRIKDYKYHKAIQVMLYAFLFTKTTCFKFDKPLKAGIFSFKNLKGNFLKMNFSQKKVPDTSITPKRIEEFIIEIKSILTEIYDSEIPFKEPEKSPFK